MFFPRPIPSTASPRPRTRAKRVAIRLGGKRRGYGGQSVDRLITAGWGVSLLKTRVGLDINVLTTSLRHAGTSEEEKMGHLRPQTPTTREKVLLHPTSIIHTQVLYIPFYSVLCTVRPRWLIFQDAFTVFPSPSLITSFANELTDGLQCKKNMCRSDLKRSENKMLRDLECACHPARSRPSRDFFSRSLPDRHLAQPQQVCPRYYPHGIEYRLSIAARRRTLSTRPGFLPALRASCGRRLFLHASVSLVRFRRAIHG